MRTRWRQRTLWLVAALALLLGTGLLWLAAPNRICQANCDKIQIGWTIAQVEALLGEGRTYDNCTWYWGDVVGDTIIVETDNDKRVLEKRVVPDNLTNTERLYRKTRISVREALSLPPEP